MLRRLQWICRNEVVMFQEPATHFRGIENHGKEKDEEHDGSYNILDRVVWVEWNAVQRDPILILVLLDLNTVRIV